MAHYEVYAPLKWTRDVELDLVSNNNVVVTNKRERVRVLSDFMGVEYVYPFQNKQSQEFYDFYEFVRSMGFDQHSFQLVTPFQWNTTDGLFDSNDIPTAVNAITSQDQPLINTVTNTNEGDGSTTLFKCAIDFSVSGGPSTVERLQNTLDASLSQWGMASAILAYNGVTTVTPSAVDHGAATITLPAAPTAGQFPKWGGVFCDVVKFVGFEAGARDGAIYAINARLRRTLI